MAQYKRILLKLSGESLMGGKSYGIDETRLSEYAAQIKEIADMQDISQGTVKSRLSRGRSLLALELENSGIEIP